MRRGGPTARSRAGLPGFVQVTAPDELAFPDYDGNGMFKSLGNMLVNPSVGLLFIAMHGRPRRLRVNGTATVSREDALLARTVGAQLIVRVKAHAIFPNCPRYIPKPRAGRAVGLYAASRPATRSSPRGRASTSSRTWSTRASRRLGETRHSDQYRKEWIERTQRFANPTTQLSIEGLETEMPPAVWVWRSLVYQQCNKRRRKPKRQIEDAFDAY